MRLLLTVLVLVIVASSVDAQSFDAPTYSVGDTWTLKEGSSSREIKVLKVGDGGTVEMVGFLSQCPTCIVQLDRRLTIMGVLDGGGKPADPTQIGFVPMGSSWQLFNFPLEPKKRWDFTASAFSRGRSENYEVSSRVEGLEDVKTPAGTFKAYRIVRDIVLKGGQAQARVQDLKWQTTTWFAPDVKYSVKSTSTNRNAQDTELLSYSLK